MNEEKLNELLAVEKKNLRSSRIRTILLAIIAAVLVVGVVIVAVNIGKFNQTVMEFSETVTELATDLKTEVLKEIDDLELEQVDLDKVNSAVAALKEAAANLAEVDVTNLNDLISELENVASSLSSVTDGIKKIFGK